MSCHPTQLWNRLSAVLQTRIRADLTALLQEVIDAQLRTHYPQHLARKAVIYIRQSTPHQVVSHQESLRLQYALGARARQFGWPEEAIDIIDDDLGLTAATAHHGEVSIPWSRRSPWNRWG